MSHDPASVTIRPARDSDVAALTDLAALDSGRVPSAPVLVAEVSGRIVAAVGAGAGERIADPFEPTAEVLELLSLRARRLAAADGRRLPVGRPRRRRRGAAARAA